MYRQISRKPAETIRYGDRQAHIMLWQKALLLVPLWAIPIVPILGFICKGLGPAVHQFGFAILICLCANYFFEDLLKRKIRLDNHYIFFGFRAVAIKDISAILVIYKANGLLPEAIVLSVTTGQDLKFRLSGLTNADVGILVKHLQTGNSNIEVAPVLPALIKCRTIAKRIAQDDWKPLRLLYRTHQPFGEVLEIFKDTAGKWTRMGPLVASVVLPAWIVFISWLYTSFRPLVAPSTQAIKLQDFLQQVLFGVTQLTFKSIGDGATAFAKLVGNPLILVPVLLSLFGFYIYVQRLLLKPNRLIVDDKGCRFALSVGGAVIPLLGVSWSDLKRAILAGKGDARIGSLKLRLVKSNDKTLDIDLNALPAEGRVRLLKRIERHAPTCTIDHEVSQSMLPSSEHSYTEIWLQSLTQAPHRATLEPLHPGQLVGENRFEILKRIGIGGQGTAYLSCVLDSEEANQVVLKETIIPTFVDSVVRRKALERFEREARMLQALQDDHVVKLCDYFVEDHRAYLVLEYIDGFTLRELVLRDGPMAQDDVCALGIQMCEILKLLHSNSMVHRDFTPENLILSSTGKLKLIDFNVAQEIQAGTTGTIVGKHAYVPPEQFRGKPTAQSDLYALGATMYFLLTGVDPEAVSQSSPATYNGSICVQLDEIVKKLTALNAVNRYQSANDVRADIAAASESGSTVPLVSVAAEGGQDG